VPKKEKLETVQQLKKVLADASGVYFTDCSKVKANEIATLRYRLRESDVVTKVVKNRLALLAFKELGFDDSIRPFLIGPTSLIITTKEPITPARVLKELMKKFAAIKIKGAYIDKTVFAAEQFNLLANLPTRPELQATLVGVLHQPIQGVVFILDNLLANLVFSLDAISQKKETTEKPNG
jgi:large subunit ribosomal protein L10